VPAVSIYQSAIQPEWIDYNGHLRDAYYGLIFSYAIDALMDRIGVDAAYRERSGGTLYTLEEHIHYLDALKQGDVAEVSAWIIDADRKRLHAGFEMRRAGAPRAAATGEFMLLHVQQSPTPASAPFPPEVSAQIEALRAATADAAGSPDTAGAAGTAGASPGSRRIQIKR
jgi:acyl-CoA thioester hydrolase